MTNHPPTAQPRGAKAQAAPAQTAEAHASDPQNTTTLSAANMLKNVLLILVTVCVLALCFALPTVATKMQDSLIEAKFDSVAVNPVILVTTSEDNIGELLRFSGLGYEAVDYKISVSPEEIAAEEQVLMEILDYFEDVGAPLIDTAKIADLNVMPFLVKSTDMDSARLLWECFAIDDEGNSAMLFIDDTTEMMLSFSVGRNATYKDSDPLTTGVDGYGDLGGDANVDSYPEPEADSYPEAEAETSVKDPSSDTIAAPVYDTETSDAYVDRWIWGDAWANAEVLAQYYGFASVEDVSSQIDNDWGSSMDISGWMVFLDDSGERIGCSFRQMLGELNVFEFNVALSSTVE